MLELLHNFAQMSYIFFWEEEVFCYKYETTLRKEQTIFMSKSYDKMDLMRDFVQMTHISKLGKETNLWY